MELIILPSHGCYFLSVKGGVLYFSYSFYYYRDSVYLAESSHLIEWLSVSAAQFPRANVCQVRGFLRFDLALTYLHLDINGESILRNSTFVNFIFIYLFIYCLNLS